MAAKELWNTQHRLLAEFAQVLRAAADTRFMRTSTIAPAGPGDASPERHAPFPLYDQRGGASDLEVASQMLSHAVHYLISEQLAGRRVSAQANREAIAILCSAGRQLGEVERREPARNAIATWLRGASLQRATQHRSPSHGD